MEELLELAKVCSNVPVNPAKTFYEAIQSIYFIFFLCGDSLGRVDQYLNPFYENDLKNGAITEEKALLLLECYYIKVFEKFGYENQISALNHMTIGGLMKDGSGGYNKVSRLILRVLQEINLWRPQVTLRWYEGFPHDEFKMAVKANKDVYYKLMFTNDEIMVHGLTKMEIAYEDAVNYTLSGCNEVIITGMSQMGSVRGFFNLLKPLEFMFKLGNFNMDNYNMDNYNMDDYNMDDYNMDDYNVDILSVDENVIWSIGRFDEFFKLYKEQLKKTVIYLMNISELYDTHRCQTTDLLISLVTYDCIGNMKSFNAGGAKYNFCNWCAVGIVNITDSLSVIKQFVYDEKRYTIKELVNMLKNNWAGYEDELRYIQNNGNFFGNDLDYVDSIMAELIDSLYEYSFLKTPVRGGRYNFGTLTGVENMHVVFGNVTAATPDGRHNSDNLVASIGANPGRDINGVTAFLKSVSKMDFTKLPSSVVVNIRFEKSMINSDIKLEKITSLIETYFKLGGVQLQINYVSAEDLIKAKQDPANYENLRVRVTGYSGKYVAFDEKLQDEIISRTVYGNA